MLIKSKHLGHRGFSLVEVLVVVVLLGLVTMATMSLYIDTQKTTNTSEEVIDVQQNIRIAMDQMLRDIRFAGLLIPADQAPVAAAPQFSTDLNDDGDCADAGESPGGGSDCFAFQTASTSGRLARIGQNPLGDSPADPNTAFTVVVASPDMTDLFESGANTGDWVRIIRPVDASYPLDRVFRVTAKDRTNSQLQLTGFNVATTYQTGDAVIRVVDTDTSDTDPNTNPPEKVQTISYRLQDDPNSTDPAMRILVRRASDGNDAIVANNIVDLQFSYLMDDNTELNSVTTASRLDNILAVRVVLTGATDVTRTGNPAVSGVKTRVLEGVAKIRNLKVQD